MQKLSFLTASDALARMKAGELTCEEYVRACIERIWAREPEVGAWQYLDPEHALAQARERDRERTRGLLHGIPFALKDVVDTAGMPTAYGSLAYGDHRPARDAACVALCRSAGAVVLGKTVTTEFAARHPGRTRNPLDPRRTPGGSSSGSAAAVADGMVTLAFGTQTVGSTIRPASYCGVYAYKPSFGLLSFSGVKHLSETFDTLGLFARSLDDLDLFRSAASGLRRRAPRRAASRAPRIAFCRTPYWDRADPTTRASLETAAKRLAAAGAEVAEVNLPEGLGRAEKIIWEIVYFEMARILAPEMREHPENLSPWIAQTIERGRNIPIETYLERLREVEELRAAGRAALERFEVVLAPSAPGEAPEGVSDTGPPIFQAPWHLMNLPAVNLPALRGPTGLPVGIQLVGHFRQDDTLFAAGRWIERRLK